MKKGVLKNMPFADRFWAQVKKNGDNECWLWTGYVGSRGYGFIKRDYRTLLTHRVSYEFAFGPANDLSVCHRCDTPLCVNPRHLFLGTAKDNSDDMVSKGRQPRVVGSKHGGAKLTEAEASAIRASSKKGRDLAVEYGVSPSTISVIKNGKSWSYLLGSDGPAARASI
jgi:hypothetical protein